MRSKRIKNTQEASSVMLKNPSVIECIVKYEFFIFYNTFYTEGKMYKIHFSTTKHSLYISRIFKENLMYHI